MKIKPGEKLPEIDFFYLNEKNEVKKITTNDLFKKQKAIILGMPGAFTKTCSAVHLPGYVKNYELALNTYHDYISILFMSGEEEGIIH